MKRLGYVFSFLFLLCAQNALAQSEDYKSVIDLSLKIKRLEKKLFGVNAGSFSTKPPQATPADSYLVLGQNKLKLAPDYLATDYQAEPSSKPDEGTLSKKFPNYDITVIDRFASNEEEVPTGIADNSKIDQVIAITHEDFHHYRDNSSNPPRSIEESFALAFSNFMANVILLDYFHETELKDELEFSYRRVKQRNLDVRFCYGELNRLYHSRLLSAEKLQKRDAIFELCSKKLGEPVNNAVLSFEFTYSKYFFYATNQIRRFGVKKFVRAYLAMPDIEDEKSWIAEFDRRVKEPDE